MINLRYSFGWGTGATPSWSVGDAAYSPADCVSIPDGYLQTVRSLTLNYTIQSLGIRFYLGSMADLSCKTVVECVFKRAGVEIGRIPLTDGNNIITGSWGAGSFSFHVEYVGTPIPDCSVNADCPDGQKCIDGECVDCEDQAATHFKIREEYDEIASLVNGELVGYQESGLYPLPVDNQSVDFSNHNQSRAWLRIIFTDSSGNPAPYTGSFEALIGFPDVDNQFGIQWWWAIDAKSNISYGPYDCAHDIQGGRISSFGFRIPESEEIYETACSGVVPEVPVVPTPPPSILPPPPEVPDEPDEPELPIEPLPHEPPEPVVPPTPPVTGCECETYVGQTIVSFKQSFENSLALLVGLSDQWLSEFHNLFKKLFENLQYIGKQIERGVDFAKEVWEKLEPLLEKDSRPIVEVHSYGKTEVHEDCDYPQNIY